MKKLILLLVAIICVKIVYSVADGDSTLGISISWDGGDSYTEQKFTPFTCQSYDSYKTFGGGAELWGRNWTEDELSNSNFMVRMNLTAQQGATARMTVDHIQVKIYYSLPEPTLTFVSPTPENNTVTGSTLRINVSSDYTLTNCLFESNITGVLANITMTLDADTSCSITKVNLLNNTFIEYKVYGSTSDGFMYNTTETRFVTVNTNTPIVELISPENNSVDSALFRLLEYNITDIESDLMSVTIYASNSTNLNKTTIVRYLDYLPNGTYTYNFTTLPLDSTSEGLYAMYHFNNDSDYGESDSLIYDFSGNGNNGTIGEDAYFNATEGKIYGSYGFTDNNFPDSDYIKIGTDYEFYDLCENGCTMSAWFYRTEANTNRILISRYDTSPTEYYFNFYVSSSNKLTFNIYDDYDNSSAVCSAVIDTPLIELSRWYHAVGGFNGTNCYAYLNGVLGDSTETNIKPNSSNWNYTLDTLIGAYHILSPTHGGTWRGYIDEVGIWNRSLNYDEVQSIYRLKNGTYYWNVSVTDGDSSDWKQWQFNISEVDVGDCIFDCTTDTITSDIDCLGMDFIVNNAGTLEVGYDITNVDRIIGNGCKIVVATGLMID